MLGNIKNKKFILCLIVLGIFSFGPASLAALNVAWPSSPFGTKLEEGSLTIAILIQYLYEWGLGIGGIAVFIILIFAGIEYLTSAGNTGKMTDALNRIKSAILGLVLLLASVLVLNTINPQLTNLKMPTFGNTTSSVSLPIGFSDRAFEDCKKAALYSDSNLRTPSATPLNEISVGENTFQATFGIYELQIGSLRFSGDCSLLLFPEGNSDNPITIAGIGGSGSEIKNIRRTYGIDKFVSYSLNHASGVGGRGLGVCPTQACLYVDANYQGNVLPVSITETLGDNAGINSEVSSIEVENEYIAVLHEHENFEGKCLKVNAPGTADLDDPNTVQERDIHRLENDMASAIILLKAAEDQNIPFGAVKLCENAGCSSGWTEVITGDTPQVMHNDGASAIELAPGYAAVIFGDAKYEADCVVITKTTEIKGHLSVEGVSSIQVMKIDGVVGDENLFMHF